MACCQRGCVFPEYKEGYCLHHHRLFISNINPMIKATLVVQTDQTDQQADLVVANGRAGVRKAQKTDKQKPRQPRVQTKFMWLVNRLVAGEDPLTVPVPFDMEVQVYAAKIRTVINENKLTRSRRWAIRTDPLNVTISCIGSWEKPVDMSHTDAAVRVQDTSYQVFDRATIACKCGKPLRHRGRCKGAGRPVERTTTPEPQSTPEGEWQWLYDAIAEGDELIIAQAPEGVDAARAFVSKVREIVSQSGATPTIRWRFSSVEDSAAISDGLPEAQDGEMARTIDRSSYSAASNEEPKEETPPPASAVPRTLLDAERELLEAAVTYWTNTPDDDFECDRLNELMNDLGYEVKYRREARSEMGRIEDLIDWGDAKSIEEFVNLATDAIYRARVQGIADGVTQKWRHK